MESYHYKAFISYSHKDHRWGGWLHRRLERYRLPKHLIKTGESGRLKPIFRDREDLAAADSLSEKIEQAIAASENLIVICSPRAAKSHWVNQEVLCFKRQNRGAKIFSIIVDGEPFSTKTGNGADECMPPALRFQLGADGEMTDKPAEPLAADLRTSGDGKRLGVLKIISGMLGVGLDELVQRDLQRNRNRVTAITAGAMAVVLAMGTLTGFALSARKEAEVKRVEAEARRNAAEDMIEFMITELKPELEAVGRLKPLSIVGERAAKYYEDLPLTSHNDNALGRRARVFHLIGEIEDKYGNLDKAKERFEEAYASTKALLTRDPQNVHRIFDHAQSAYWAGHIPYQEKLYAEVEPYFQEYLDLTKILMATTPNSQQSMEELAYSSTNMGVLVFKQGNMTQAYQIYQTTIPAFLELTRQYPESLKYKIGLANAYGWWADTAKKLGLFDEAKTLREKQRHIYRTMLNQYPKNRTVLYQDINSAIGLAKLNIETNNITGAENIIKQALVSSSKLVQFDNSNVEWMFARGYLKLLKAETLQNRLKYDDSANLLDEVKSMERVLESRALKPTRDSRRLRTKRLLLQTQYDNNFAAEKISINLTLNERQQ